MEQIYSLTAFVPRTFKQLTFFILNVIAIILLYYFGYFNLGKYSIIVIGFAIAVLVSLSFRDFVLIAKQNLAPHASLLDLKHLFIGFVISCVGYVLFSYLESIYVIPVVRTKTDINFLIVLYPIFVAVQQFLYMLAPNVIFRNYNIAFRFLYCTLFFGMAHVYYGFPTVLAALFMVGIPCATLTIFFKNQPMSFIFHLLVGPIGLYLQYV
ncbi:hypothetical protein KC866_01625 [Patescibacteria group bacterium]|nr:hypothetical protein [Patescibacteria group bacterium]